MMFRKAAFIIFVLGLFAGLTNAKPLNQDPGPDGIISVEAEHYDDNVAVGGHAWELTGPTGGFTGILGMHAPNGRGGHNSNYLTNSERLDYEIDFVKTGVYYVWILGWGETGGDDSCHGGIDGEAVPNLVAMTGWSNAYEWNNDLYQSNERPSFEITTIGVHTFNLWVREDGLIVDKIVITSNPNFSLSGNEPGPRESIRGPRVTASGPAPSDGATDVSRDLVLGWKSGVFAGRHDVYFGENLDDVNNASTTVDPAGVYKGRVIPNSYALPERLEFDKTYYWRIDEVNAAPDNTVRKGDVWSFRTELFAYEIQNVSAAASSSDPGKEAGNTVNGSGLDPNGLHTNIGEGNMWLSAANADLPAWIQFEFQGVQKLHEMWVWNSNESLETVIGLGFKNVTIEYSVDGENYATLGTTHEFNQGTGQAGYAYNTTIDMEGIAAKYVKLTANSGFKDLLKQFGLSEVRFFSIPVQAREPDPGIGDSGIELDLNLNFRAGREGVKHDVYFSEDLQAVKDGTVQAQTVTETSYGPLALDLGTTYFWRVDEVNEAEPITTWPGDIWFFITQEYFVLDDFEAYNSEENQIWYAWKDGLGYGTPQTPPYYAGNGTGAAVGDETTPSFTEETNIHSGKQSMPLAYNNSKQGYLNYSEAIMTLSSNRDWTVRGVEELSIWFRGLPGSVGSFTEGPAGTYTITAAGADIWNQADEFHYAYKQLTGVGSISVKVQSVENTNVWAKAGVMIRETLDPGSKFAAVYITPTNTDGTPTQGCRFQGRTDTDGSASSDSSVATNEQKAVTAPYWIKLERDFSGNFRGYYSSDGVNWSSMVWRPSISMASNVYIGLALTSHVTALTGNAVFSNVQTTGTVTGQWQSQDIGIPSNSAEPIYVAVGNSTGSPAIVSYDDQAATQIDTWTEWVIPTQALADQGVNLADVDNIAIGIGDRNNPQPGGSGTIFIDDIRLYPHREPPVEIMIEAESAGVMGASWRLYDDPNASGGQSIGSDDGDGDDFNIAPGDEWRATYNFTTPATGIYKILFRGQEAGSDSFWVRIPDAVNLTPGENPDQPGTGWIKFNGMDSPSGWAWDEVHSDDHSGAIVNWVLAAGEHTLEIAKREDGVLLDAILITDDLALDQTTLP